MPKALLTRHELAQAAARDAANRRMRKAGRYTWTRGDYNLAVREYDRLNPMPDTAPTRGAAA